MVSKNLVRMYENRLKRLSTAAATPPGAKTIVGNTSFCPALLFYVAPVFGLGLVAHQKLELSTAEIKSCVF